MTEVLAAVVTVLAVVLVWVIRSLIAQGERIAYLEAKVNGKPR